MHKEALVKDSRKARKPGYADPAAPRRGQQSPIVRAEDLGLKSL